MSSFSKTSATTAAVLLSLLASCNQPYDVSGIATIAAPENIAPANPEDVARYAQQFLDGIQPVSFRESREYCGFFVEAPDGTLAGTPPRAGTADGCVAGFVPGNAVASYHTHGGYLPNYFNEIPSINDAQSAVEVRLDDYVSTPGGRFWKVDGTTGTATVLCGVGCLQQDPIFVPDTRNPPAPWYTMAELIELQS